MTLYTQEVKQIVRERPPFTGFIFDVVEYPNWLTFRMYRDNFELFSDFQRSSLAEWFSNQIARVRKLGIPCYAEVFEFVPNRRRVI